MADTAPLSLCDREPHVPADRLVAEMVPPPRFDSVRFDTYIPDPNQPSQTEAVRVLAGFAAGLSGAHAVGGGKRGFLGFGKGLGKARAARTPAGPRGVYLDGGYGVGKTHLLASLWHATPAEPSLKAFGTFVELTNLVGALGFQKTVQTLSGHRLLCIDEFELDDPGDTVLMSRLLRELADRDVALAATSNTLPEALGEGRFAAEDFLREIQALSSRFEVLRVDGEDYRHRAVVTEAAPLAADVVADTAAARPGAVLDTFDDLLAHLATVHPSRYGALLDGVELVALTGVRPVHRQEVALRLVVLVDRLYDRDVPVLLAGEAGQHLFTEEMLRGGYRKKYYRALSRLGALAEEGRRLVPA